jgi:nicotinate phosphoribosyltransferase
MWLTDATPALFTDLYELTMAQVYFRKAMDETAHFEVLVRQLPEHWGFFVMAGLPEVESYLRQCRFGAEDVDYLRSTKIFADDFLEYLAAFEPDVKIRALPEGTIFFANEPIVEVSGPILHAQLLETYILNILGFSIIEATLGARLMIAARGLPVIDFGLRRCQGPISSIRAARGGQIAGFSATSNVFAARLLSMPSSGTMAHSFIEAHDSEEQAFQDYAEIYGDRAILLVDTYDSVEGIKTAARVAKKFAAKGIRIRGIRLDSGDLLGLSRYAREHFKKQGLEFLKILASGDLDEFRIADLLAAGAEIDGFGVGTRFTVSQHAPSIGIVYKIVQYGDRPLHKTSPDKATLPGRKTIIRESQIPNLRFTRDVVKPLDPNADDLLVPFESAEPMTAIQQRLQAQLAALPDSVKAIRAPRPYPVQFIGFPTA